MTSEQSPSLSAALLSLLEGDGRDPLDRIDDMVEALDRAILRDVLHDVSHGMAAQTLARAVIALGSPLLQHTNLPQIALTLEAARAYADSPDDKTKQAYLERATHSYPYGPGDGHLGLDDRGCEPGSGCTSGAGTLRQTANALGGDTALHALAAALSPWLHAHPD
ncbi:hypothetical protein BM536_006955 [Streptomyces phaeoluteigriseus]|uniref:Uncharacterized protein n=1 Tax=Streptomyces phaeoluteigriseus TaxID=114686 RepID=A0A1V6MWL2_9ACTN|nr:hypothetical protein [Streptomyces phaeoluteigriseus]OQD56850.1 hypothetical protein BM536_006955 [Streptomyces phaeoluteigriseus]